MVKITIHIITSTPDAAAKMLDEIKQSILLGRKVDGQDGVTILPNSQEYWNFIIKGDYVD